MCGALNAQTYRWSRLTPAGNGPASATLSGMVYDPATNQLILTAPSASTASTVTLWSLDLARQAWLQGPQLAGYSTGFPAPPDYYTLYDAAKSVVMFDGMLSTTILSNANQTTGVPALSGQSWDGKPNVGLGLDTAGGTSGIYDPISNRVVAFGGISYWANDLTNNLRVLSNANGSGDQTLWATPPQSGIPPYVTDHSAVYDAASNRMIVFGGNFGDQSISDQLWMLSNANALTGTPAWTQLTPGGDLITGRYGHIAVYDPDLNAMLVYGGHAAPDGAWTNELWVLRNANGIGGTPEWNHVQAQGDSPTGQVSAAIDVQHKAVYYLGAQDSAAGPVYNQVWALNYAPSAPMVTTAAPLAAATVNAAYSNPLGVYGGTAPYSWTVTGGSLPQGLSLSKEGLLSGTPGAAGNSQFTVQVTDSQGQSGSATLTLAAGAPPIDYVVPSSVEAGSAAFTLTVAGSGFAPGATVMWGVASSPTPSAPTAGSAAQLATTYVSPAQLTATVPASLIATPGAVQIMVASPDGTYYTAQPAVFVITGSASGGTGGPAIYSLSPATAVAGSSGVALTVVGGGFVKGGALTWTINGQTALLPAKWRNSATLLTAAVPWSLLTLPGTAEIQYSNPDGRTSAQVAFQITGPAVQPVVSSVTPSPVTAGGAGFVVTLHGSAFVPGGGVYINVHGSSTRLGGDFIDQWTVSADVPAALIATAGTAQLTYQNPDGTVSTAATLTISAPGTSAPFVSSLSTQVIAPADYGDVMVRANGGGFDPAGKFHWTLNYTGSDLSAIQVNASQMLIRIPAALLQTAGTALIHYVAPDGATSADQEIQVVPYAPLPIPVGWVTSLSPQAIAAGSGESAIMVDGSGFTAATFLHVESANGLYADVPAIFLGPSRYLAELPQVGIATPGDVYYIVPGVNGTYPLPYLRVLDSGKQLTGPIIESAYAGPPYYGGPSTWYVDLRGVNLHAGGAVLFTQNGQTIELTATVEGTFPSAYVEALFPATAPPSPGLAEVSYRDSSGDISEPRAVTVAGGAPPALLVSVTPARVAPIGHEVVVEAQSLAAPFSLDATAVFTLNGKSTNLPTLVWAFESADSFIRLNAVVPASLLATPGPAQITVRNGDGTVSNSVGFVIEAANPVIQGTGPSELLAGGGDSALLLTGSGFAASGAAYWTANGQTANLPAYYLDSSRLMVLVPAQLLSQAGTGEVSYVDPLGQRSPGMPVPVVDPLRITAGGAFVTSVAPSLVPPGMQSITLTLQGSGFTPSGVAYWTANGSRTALATTFVNASQVTAVVPASLIGSGGSAQVSYGQ
jgi:hypothetical protein